MKDPILLWNEEEGLATCIITYNNKEFSATAKCHPDDADMQSRLTGQNIAEWRAVLKILRYKRDCEIAPQLKALKQLYYSMNRSKHFNRKSYEAKMLYRQINNLTEDLQAIKDEIKIQKYNFNLYLQAKEKYYQTIRTKRQDKAN